MTLGHGSWIIRDPTAVVTVVNDYSSRGWDGGLVWSSVQLEDLQI